MKRTFHILLAAACLGTGYAKETQTSLDAALSTFREGAVGEKLVAGVVTAVGSKEKVLSIGATGFADIAGQRPMKTDSVAWIASMSKPVTGVAVMMMVEEGRISLDDPVAKYLPEFKELKDANGNEVTVTIAQCMSHTAGLQDLSREEEARLTNLDQVMKLTASRPVKFAPGTKWVYCQTGINVGGRIVEVVSQQNFADFLEKRLFGPLGMKDTSFYPGADQVARLAFAYKKTDAGLEVEVPRVLAGKDYGDKSRYPRANGGLFSTAEDFSKFLAMVLNGGEANGHRFLKPESINEMTKSRTDGLEKVGFVEGNAYGIGWIRVVNPGGVTASLSPGSYGHGGAYGTQAWIDPVKGRYSVLIIQHTNIGNGDGSVLRGNFQGAAAK
jgi:CubicO group peptidase (beta-lactamase class C family)